MTAADWIDDLERKAKAATPGPWEATQEGLTHPDGWEIDAPDGPVVSECCGYRGSVGKTADAEFIAAANPTTILRLIEAARRAEDYNAEAERHAGRVVALEAQNEDLTAERDELAAKVARVEALADEWDKSDDTHEWILAADLRAALTEQENDQ